MILIQFSWNRRTGRELIWWSGPCPPSPPNRELKIQGGVPLLPPQGNRITEEPCGPPPARGDRITGDPVPPTAALSRLVFCTGHGEGPTGHVHQMGPPRPSASALSAGLDQAQSLTFINWARPSSIPHFVDWARPEPSFCRLASAQAHILHFHCIFELQNLDF